MKQVAAHFIQMEIILQCITKNRLVLQKTIMQVENRLYSKIVTLEETLADYRMQDAMHSRVTNLEDQVNNIRRDLKVWVS
jgi:hypothetical protein